MGSPAFGLPTLQAIEQAGHAVTLVVTQPDRPAGRARRLRPPPVAAYARSRQLPLHQPERLRPTSALAPIQAADPEVIVVAAFGLLLPAALLALPRHGCLNVHPSLLPSHRGASPIQAAILGGDAKTGVTIIKLVEQMDAGPILAQTATPIGPDEDAIALEGRLAELGAALLVDCLEPWVAGAIEPRPQDEQLATYCRRLDRTDALLDWSQPAERLGRVRAGRRLPHPP
jgi:methionyl-tRNA formyltransferase